jgi:hypothetical protein
VTGTLFLCMCARVLSMMCVIDEISEGGKEGVRRLLIILTIVIVIIIINECSICVCVCDCVCLCLSSVTVICVWWLLSVHVISDRDSDVYPPPRLTLRLSVRTYVRCGVPSVPILFPTPVPVHSRNSLPLPRQH